MGAHFSEQVLHYYCKQTFTFSYLYWIYQQLSFDQLILSMRIGKFHYFTLTFFSHSFERYTLILYLSFDFKRTYKHTLSLFHSTYLVTYHVIVNTNLSLFVLICITNRLLILPIYMSLLTNGDVQTSTLQSPLSLWKMT